MHNLIQNRDISSNHYFDVYVPEQDQESTLYLIGPYRGRKLYYNLFIKAMEKRGYRVVYLQPSSKILDPNHPQRLEHSIQEATRIIRKDMSPRNPQSASLMGMSLGSYIGLNVLAKTQIKKFVVVAGGAPLEEVFNTAGMFGVARMKSRKKIKEGQLQLDHHWYKFDHEFKASDFKGRSILAINSSRDNIVTPKRRTEFLSAVEIAGSQVIDNAEGTSSHIVQALSPNWQIDQIESFLNQ